MPTLLSLHRLLAQEEFREANDKLNAFFDKASTVTKSPEKRASVANATTQLPAIINGLLGVGILRYLNGTAKISTEDLKEKIARSLTPSSMGNEIAPYSAGVLSLDAAQTYVIAYDVPFCAVCTYSWLGVITRKDGIYRIRDYLLNSSPNQTVNLSKIETASTTLVALYGVNWGDPHNRLSVHVYDISGHLNEVWSLLDLPQGRLAIKGNRIILSYLTAPTPPYKQERQTFEAVDGKVRLVNTEVVAAPE
jgi:hypothetical protein